MKKTTRNKIILSSTLLFLLFGTKIKMDRDTSALNKRIVEFAKTNKQEDIKFVAHRGYSNMYPDNTLESIKACSELKCIEGIECDVRLTKDNQLVLMHNDFIGLRPIYDFTYDELRSMNLKDHLIARPTIFKGYDLIEQQILAKRYEGLKASTYTLCTLEEVLRVRDKSKVLFIDIKFTGYNDNYLLARIGELVKNEKNIIIQSFNGNKLREMHELYPEYTYQLLVDSRSGITNIDYMFDGYGIRFNVLDDDTIEDLTRHDKIVSLWTVDSYKDFNGLVEKYKESNSDIYYITNNPDVLSYKLTNKK